MNCEICYPNLPELDSEKIVNCTTCDEKMPQKTLKAHMIKVHGNFSDSFYDQQQIPIIENVESLAKNVSTNKYTPVKCQICQITLINQACLGMN